LHNFGSRSSERRFSQQPNYVGCDSSGSSDKAHDSRHHETRSDRLGGRELSTGPAFGQEEGIQNGIPHGEMQRPKSDQR